MSTMTCTGVAFIWASLTCTVPDPTPPATVCPPVKTWSRQFQQQIAHELAAAPGSALAAVTLEAIKMRDVARACARRR